ncbi:MAG TPA: aminotransferase class V-fold PLP-dependent enzyme [Actinomycetota bacterium]
MWSSLAPRADFPVLEEAAYLNAASIALMPLPVRRAMQAFMEEIAGRGTIGFDDDAEAAVYDGVRSRAARLLGAEPADVAVTTSASEALGQVAWWLRPGEGENVVSIDIEFPSVTYAWMRVAEETGVEVRLVRALEASGGLSLEDVAELVDDRTAAVCVSHVQYATGHLLDLRGLADLAHAHGALAVVDATQSAGMIPIDVREADVDVLVSGGYKWLCATFGAALCYLHSRIAERFLPPLIGWRSTPNPPDFDATRMPLAEGARRLEYSTVAYPSGIGLGEAIEYILGLGVDRILEHDLGLTDKVTAGLEELGGTLISAPRDVPRGSIATARFPGRRPERLVERLIEADVIAGPRLGGVRISPHLYNDVSDVDRALAQLERILETPEDD